VVARFEPARTGELVEGDGIEADEVLP